MRLRLNFSSSVLLVILFTCLPSVGQPSDTLIVSATPVGNLNRVINADTLAGAESAHIYLLAPNAVIDTIYFVTEEIRTKNLMLVGKTNPVTGHPPLIAPFINEDNSSPDNIAVTIDNGYIHFKNLYLLGTRFDGLQLTSQCVSARDGCRLIMENCVFENFGSTGTANILNTWNAIGSDIFISNCLFRNNQSDIPQNPGMNWAGPGVFAIDTMIIKNSTFFVFGGNVVGSGSSIGYLEFDHNTIFMQTKSSPFSMRQMHNARITNNIFYSVYSSGLDSMHAFCAPGLSSNFCGQPAILMLDSLYEDLEGDPYYLTEAERKIEAVNNAYFWPQTIRDNFDILNSDPKYQIVGGKIYAPVWVATPPGTEAILTDRDSWPGIDIYTNNDNIDPGFDAALVQTASDNMAGFVRHIWENGGNGAGAKPFVYLSDPIYVFAVVAENWAEMQGYPVRENLRYTNPALLTAGTDGLPLGDLNWFPEKMPTQSPLQPFNFRLEQNYPNPFNSTTIIKYQLGSVGTQHAVSLLLVNLSVYNLLGEKVATLVNKYQQAGRYSVTFDASHLASGIYFYRMQAGHSSQTKKMILLR